MTIQVGPQDDIRLSNEELNGNNSKRKLAEQHSGDRAAVYDHHFTVHKAVAITDHEGSVFTIGREPRPRTL